MYTVLRFAPFAILLVPMAPGQETLPKSLSGAKPDFLPVVGAMRWHSAQAGETLLTLAHQYDTDRFTLARLNGLNPLSGRLKPGRKLLLPTRFILPMRLQNGLVLNLPERGVYLFRNGTLIHRYPVAIGRVSWQTPTGAFFIGRKVKDPTWLPPQVMVRREGAKERAIPPGPGNPIGDRWMGWHGTQVGFHNTYVTESVGQAASHACARMYMEDGHNLFERISVGDPVYSIYEPIKIGSENGKTYLSISPDIYGKGRVSLAQTRKRLKQADLPQPVDEHTLREIVAHQDGYPHSITPEKFPL